MERLEPGFELVQDPHNPSVRILRVDADVLQCAQRKLPYATYLGTVNVTTKRIKVWSPAASIPRGYRDAAKLALQRALRVAAAEG